MNENGRDYVLLTAARNEESYIEDTILSVVAQKRRPLKWVIISDGSTDETDRIIQSYVKQYDFIVYARRDEKSDGISFARKVFALRHGYGLLAGLEYQFIGNLDADITFDESYYENLLEEFQKNPKLGIAGGMLFEESNGKFTPRYLSEMRYVPGGVQLFRRTCYEQVGGYLPSRWGGEDTIALVMARMNGWEVKSIPGIHGFHNKSSVVTRGLLRERFRNGVMFYALGSHPTFEVIKSMQRISEKPYVIGSIVRMCGYMWAACKRETRPASNEFVRYLRNEQWTRLRNKSSGAE